MSEWTPKSQTIGIRGFDNCERCTRYVKIYSWGEVNYDLQKLCYDCFYDIPIQKEEEA